jgi:predicted  nucleic acid-binding Zn-ribbon protein
MRLKVYTSEDFYKAKCNLCSWVLDVSYKVLPKGAPCPNCGSSGFTYFPGDQSAHILGGMIHFIDSYNQKITSDRHIFPPQVYLPIIFACSNHETLLTDLVRELMKKYGKYIGQLGRFMIFDEVLSSYDKKANEKLFKALTLRSIQDAIQIEFPQYIQSLKETYSVRNNVVHGKKLDDTATALSAPNKAIDVLLESVNVFRYLNNHFVVKFSENVDYKQVIRLGSNENFLP